LVLQGRALQEGQELAAISFFASARVQTALEELFQGATATSLDVERRHAQAKRWERSRLTHVANASRNAILTRYQRVRAATGAAVHAANLEVHRANKRRIWSLVWENCAAVLPIPAGKDIRSKQRAAQPVQVGDAAALLTYAEEHADDLQAELVRRRLDAQASLDKLRGGMPVTHGDWVQWMEANEHEFGAECELRRRNGESAAAGSRPVNI
jgi:hypothetical protein